MPHIIAHPLRATAERTDGTAAARRRGRTWLWRGIVALLALLYVALWALVGLWPLNPTDLDVFFLPSARIALDGHPLFVYSLRYAEVYPNANGPLSLVPLTAAAALAQHLGWLDIPTLRRVIVQAVFALFPLLLTWEALRAIDRLLPRPIPRRWRLPLAAVFTLSPLLWQGMLLYGHIELAMMMWLLLVSVRLMAERRAGWAGVVLGLALLTRSSAVVYAVPLLGLLLRHGRWRAAVAFAGATGGVLALGLLPFFLFDRNDVLYSLVTFRGQLPIGGGSVWGIFVMAPVAAFAQQYDSWVVLGAAALVTAVFLGLRRRLDVDSGDVYVLLTLCGCCFPLFIKTVWPYYFFEEYVLVTIWWVAQAGQIGQISRIGRAARRRGWAVWWLGALLPAALVGLGELVDQMDSLHLFEQELSRWSLWITSALLLFVAALLAGWLGVTLGAARRERLERGVRRPPAPKLAPGAG
jgi:hypothetical protein